MQVIAIDAGHPSRIGDTGCQSTDGRLIEHVYTLNLAQKLANAVNAHQGFAVRMTRTQAAEVVSLSERGKRADDADLVVNIHVDSWHNPKSWGAHAFHWPGNAIGQAVAKQILCAYPPILRATRNETKADQRAYPGVWAVEGAFSQTTVLVETGFASNPKDVDALLDETVQDQIVGAMMQGLLLFRQLREATWLKRG